jgi:hypothetical protein
MLAMLNEDPTHEMEHWDVKMAFTEAPLDEEIFMYQPEGYEKEGEEKICLLKKSLYGLRQSARNLAIAIENLFRPKWFSRPIGRCLCIFSS